MQTILKNSYFSSRIIKRNYSNKNILNINNNIINKNNNNNKKIITTSRFISSTNSISNTNPLSNYYSNTKLDDTNNLVKLNIPQLELPLAHSKCEDWIIFSDLHVKLSSIDTCEEILAHVHSEAKKKNAGILFLGDFWHIRGNLNVELLNRVMKSLKEWTQPVIMIPGNHDQVSLGGTIHALEPLQYSFDKDQIVMINEPCICMNALFIPYRRDKVYMKNLLYSAKDYSYFNKNFNKFISEKNSNNIENIVNTSSNNKKYIENKDNISMIFCHADIRGAYMNDNIQSRDGLEVECFPPYLPIYSGHFHKPHLISSKNHWLRYVGSPYQTSLSEADQKKFLYHLKKPSNNNNRWLEMDKIELNIGRKFYKINNLNDTRIDSILPGDRLVLTLPFHQIVEGEKIAKKLRENNIEVEIRTEKIDFNKITETRIFTELKDEFENSTVKLNPSDENNERTERIKSLADIEPSNLFRAFLNDINASSLDENSNSYELKSNNIDNEDGLFDFETKQKYEELRLNLLKEGLSILDELSNNFIDSDTTKKSDSKIYENLKKLDININNSHRKIELDSIKLKNFGPYGGKSFSSSSTYNVSDDQPIINDDDYDVVYPLSKRGLVLLRGESLDGSGSESNGSGKTTLAMSILWALTGSMDLRYGNDGKSLDITYDSSFVQTPIQTKKKPDKIISEAVLNGKLNGNNFTIIRKRVNNKKNELFFYYNDKNLTTLSIKDTQEIINLILGLNQNSSNLLQRCFFYGQHSHISQSLLGLTDVKFKEELNALINSNIWNSGLTLLKNKEKINSNKQLELNLKNEINKNLIDKLSNESKNLEIQINKLKTELEQKKNLILKNDTESSSNSSSLTLLNLQSEESTLENNLLELSSKKANVEISKNNFYNELNSSLNQLKIFNNNKQKLEQLYNNILNFKFQLKNLKSNYITNNKLKQNEILIQNKIKKDIDNLINSLNTYSDIEGINILNNLLESFPNIDVDINDTDLKKEKKSEIKSSLSSSLLKTLSNWKEVANQFISEIAVSKKNILAYKTNSDKLKKQFQFNNTQTKTEHIHDNAFDQEICPTCNQLFTIEDCNKRLKEFEELILNEENNISNLRDSEKIYQKRLQVLQSILNSISNYKNTIQKLNSYITELNLIKDNYNKNKERLIDLVYELEEKKKELGFYSQNNDDFNLINNITLYSSSDFEEILLKDEQILNSNSSMAFNTENIDEINKKLVVLQNTIKENEKLLSNYNKEEESLRSKLKLISKQVKNLTTNYDENLTNYKIIENNIKLLNEQNNFKSNNINDINNEIILNNNLLNELNSQKIIFNKLIYLFGTKGIQHYIFSHSIKQLEYLTNNLLNVLSNGSIKLVLNDDSEKIHKNILIRSVSLNDDDDETKEKAKVIWKERSLSQLSGGQWRRVSLALDLAFSQLIIMRGLLSLNVLVADEILTHLDANGRESVGTLLKALINPSSTYSNSRTNELTDSLDNFSSDKIDENNELLNYYDNDVDVVESNKFNDQINTKKNNKYDDTNNIHDLVSPSYDTILVILQDLVATELEESFDHIDVVKKLGDHSSVLVDADTSIRFDN